MRYFISAERKELSFARNASRTVDLFDRLKDQFTMIQKADGCYYGTNEVSYEVKTRVLSHFGAQLTYIMYLAFSLYQQESILQIDHESRATLIYRDYTTKDLGTWYRVEPEFAKQQDCWNCIDGAYYVAM